MSKRQTNSFYLLYQMLLKSYIIIQFCTGHFPLNGMTHTSTYESHQRFQFVIISTLPPLMEMKQDNRLSFNKFTLSSTDLIAETFEACLRLFSSCMGIKRSNACKPMKQGMSKITANTRIVTRLSSVS